MNGVYRFTCFSIYRKELIMDREFLESLGLDENVSRRILEEHGKEG